MTHNKFNKEFFSKEVLTKVTKPIKLYKIISVDIETHGYKQMPIICGVMSDIDDKKNVYKHFFDMQEAQDYIESIADKNTYVVTTNLGFDFQGLYYDTKQWKNFKLIMKGGNTISAVYKNIHYTDTMNYIGASLKNLGHSIGIEKLSYKKMMCKVPRNKMQWKNLLEYNSRDCLITKVWTEKFQEVLNKLGCELKITKASCAMDLYRRKYFYSLMYYFLNLFVVRCVRVSSLSFSLIILDLFPLLCIISI